MLNSSIPELLDISSKNSIKFHFIHIYENGGAPFTLNPDCVGVVALHNWYFQICVQSQSSWGRGPQSHLFCYIGRKSIHHHQVYFVITCYMYTWSCTLQLMRFLLILIQWLDLCPMQCLILSLEPFPWSLWSCGFLHVVNALFHIGKAISALGKLVLHFPCVYTSSVFLAKLYIG